MTTILIPKRQFFHTSLFLQFIFNIFYKNLQLCEEYHIPNICRKTYSIIQGVHIFNDIYTFISISVFLRKVNFTLFLVGLTFCKTSRLSEGKKKPKQISD